MNTKLKDRERNRDNQLPGNNIGTTKQTYSEIRGKMSFLANLMPVVLLLIVNCGSQALPSRLGPHKSCMNCKHGHSFGLQASRDHSGPAGTNLLASGEPCGVYTLSCSRGLRCMPPPHENSPLQALLQGRGFCTKQSRLGTTEKPCPTGLHPSHSADIDKAPCRRLLNSVLRGLELTIFQSDRDIYIPNCDTRGFYRKKQCLSSKGMRRGHCWCVDEVGKTVPPRVEEGGVAPCEGE